MVLLVGCWLCDSQVADTSPGQALQHSGLRQATYTHMPLAKQYNFVPWLVCAAEKVTVLHRFDVIPAMCHT